MSTIPSPQPEPVPTRSRPPLRVVERQSRPHKGAVFAMAMVLVFFALLGNAVLSSVLVTNQQRLDGINTLVSEEQAQQQRLRLEVAQLESPDRIVEAAEAEGMIRPDSVTWLGPEHEGDVLDSGVADDAPADPPADELATDAPATDAPAGDAPAGETGTGETGTGETAAPGSGSDESGTGEAAAEDEGTGDDGRQEDALGAVDDNGSTGQ